MPRPAPMRQLRKKRPHPRRTRDRRAALALALLAVVATLINAAMASLRLRVLWHTPGAPASAIERWVSPILGPIAHDDALFFPAHYFLLALVLASSIAAVFLAVRAWRPKARARNPEDAPIPLP